MIIVDPQPYVDALISLVNNTVSIFYFYFHSFIYLTIIQADFVEMDGFNFINHLIFQEVHA